MCFVSGLCKQEGAGHGFGAAQLCVRAGFGQGLPFGFTSRAGLLNSKTAADALCLSLSTPSQPCPPRNPVQAQLKLFCSWNPILEFQAESGFHS